MQKYNLYFEGEENHKLFINFLENHNLKFQFRIVSNVITNRYNTKCYDYIIKLSEDDLMFIQLACNITKAVKMW